MKKNYSTEIRETYGNKYLKVFFANSDEAASVQKALKICNSIKNVNVTHSDSCAHKGDTLTIYPKPMFTIEEVEKETIKTLDSFFQHMVIVPEQIVSTPVFKSIKASIKEVLVKPSIRFMSALHGLPTTNYWLFSSPNDKLVLM